MKTKVIKNKKIQLNMESKLFLTLIGIRDGKRNFPPSWDETINQLPGYIERIKTNTERWALNTMFQNMIKIQKINDEIQNINPSDTSHEPGILTKRIGLWFARVSLIFIVIYLDRILGKSIMKIFDLTDLEAEQIAFLIAFLLPVAEISFISMLRKEFKVSVRTIEIIFGIIFFAIFITLAIIRAVFYSDEKLLPFPNFLLSSVIFFAPHLFLVFIWYKTGEILDEIAKKIRMKKLKDKKHKLFLNLRRKIDNFIRNKQKLIDAYCSWNELNRKDGAKFNPDIKTIQNPMMNCSSPEELIDTVKFYI
jgi:hypothetical protein